MKKTLIAILFVCTLSFAAFGQKLGKPTLTSSPLTPAQQKTLQEGVVLHDSKNYVEAIAKYRSILAENPNATLAMYELAFSLHDKGDKLEAVELANKGTRYISDELPLFYLLMANNLDDLGKPDDAIKIYQDGIKYLEGNKDYANYRASLQYNLGITYYRVKKFKEARQVLKSAVENNFGYASPHYLLSAIFAGTNYKIPAFLAACRLVSLEQNSARTRNSIATIMQTLQATSKNPKTGNTVISLDMGGAVDEGDFGTVDLLFGMMMAGKIDKNKDKSENEVFIDALDTLTGLLTSEKKLANSFVGKNYFPFMVDMKRSGNLETFGYIILFLGDKNNADAAKWIKANDGKLSTFKTWAKAYRPSAQ